MKFNDFNPEEIEKEEIQESNLELEFCSLLEDEIKLDENGTPSVNEPIFKFIVNQIHLAVNNDIIHWNEQIRTTDFLDIIGTNIKDLADYMQWHKFYDDHIGLSFSGNQDEFVDLGPKPLQQSFGVDLPETE